MGSFIAGPQHSLFLQCWHKDLISRLHVRACAVIEFHGSGNTILRPGDRALRRVRYTLPQRFDIKILRRISVSQIWPLVRCN